MKTCFKCKTEKPETEYYRHSQMGDGLLGKCKECTKQDARANRARRLEYYRQYDRERASLPWRVEARERYAQSDDGKAAAHRAKQAWMRRNPKKRSAANEVSNAIRDGKLTKPNMCQECGKANSRIEGHHVDYDKPLEVMWLCPMCHAAWHKQHGEAANAA